MRLLGRRALSGQAPRRAEQAYDVLYPLYDPALELIEPRERPSEMLAMNWDFWSSDRGKEWLQGKDATDWDHYPSSIGGHHLIAERSWFIRPDWEWPREERYRGVLIDSDGDDSDRESLASGCELTYQGYIRGDAQEGNQLIVWNSERQLAGQYCWVAMNSNVARELGWTLSLTHPFEWLDSAGHSMVKSEYWKDGWTWLEPPRFEALGEGWYVLASDLAVDAIRRAFTDAQTHLWIERHSHGDKPYKGAWHLKRRF